MELLADLVGDRWPEAYAVGWLFEGPDKFEVSFYRGTEAATSAIEIDALAALEDWATKRGSTIHI